MHTWTILLYIQLSAKVCTPVEHNEEGGYESTSFHEKKINHIKKWWLRDANMHTTLSSDIKTSINVLPTGCLILHKARSAISSPLCVFTSHTYNTTEWLPYIGIVVLFIWLWILWNSSGFISSILQAVYIMIFMLLFSGLPVSPVHTIQYYDRQKPNTWWKASLPHWNK